MEVLIIDSSADIIKRLKELVAELDSIKAIHDAVTCKEAIEKIRVIKPAIVLIDINFPNNKSLECITEIKTYQKEATIIAMSNGALPMDEIQYRLHGVTHFFDKYHEFEKIPAAIQSLAK